MILIVEYIIFQWVTSDLFTNIDDKKSVSDLSL